MAKAKELTSPAELMRGISGGVILGLPLVYTQEVWVIGASINPLGIVFLLGVTFGVNLLLSRHVGFEDERATPLEDAVQGLGLSLILSALLLVLLDRVHPDDPLPNLLGVVALTAVPTSLGFALGNALAPRGGGEGADRIARAGGQFLVAAGGAVVLSLNIAPTEEPVVIASQLGIVRMGFVAMSSLVMSYLIVFFAEFRGREQRTEKGQPFGPFSETVLAYLIALVVAGLLLVAFGQSDEIDTTFLGSAVVLAFPASMGAALGRALL